MCENRKGSERTRKREKQGKKKGEKLRANVEKGVKAHVM